MDQIGPSSHLLGPVGLSAGEEEVYRLLLARPRSEAARLARETGRLERDIRELLSSLEEKGLVNRLPSKPIRFLPTPPGLAIDALVRRRHEDLERLRVASLSAFDELVGSHEDQRDIVEVVEGRAAVVQRFEQLQRSAESELLIFDKPPYADASVNETELELLARGVTYRVVYDEDAMRYPGQLELLRQVAAAGEQARVVPDLPMKLDIADRRIALVPLKFGEPGVERCLLVHASPLLEALATLFEAIWARAVPVARWSAGEIAAESGTNSDDEALLTLLAAGLKDEAIAHQLGIGPRTVQRRIADLMERTGARNRYQLGLHVAKRGWS